LKHNGYKYKLMKELIILLCKLFGNLISDKIKISDKLLSILFFVYKESKQWYTILSEFIVQTCKRILYYNIDRRWDYYHD